MSGVEYVAVNAELEEVPLRKHLARIGLEPSPECTGGYFAYSAPAGWGMAPYSACTMWADLAGYDSSDGTPGRVILAGYYSVNAYPIMREVYRAPIELGRCAISNTISTVAALGGPERGGVVRLTVNRRREPPKPLAGVHFYLRPVAGGPTSLAQIAHSSVSNPVEPGLVEILDETSNAFSSIPAKRLRGALHLTQMALTFGVPVDFVRRVWAQNGSDIIYLIGRLSRPAMLVTDEGRVIHCNDAAKDMLGDGVEISRGHLRGSMKAGTSALRAALAGSEGQPRNNEAPLVLERPSGLAPLLLTAIHIEGRPKHQVLLIFNDPSEGPKRDTQPALRLLGLTPAEARVAALVGSGLPPRDVARLLGNTEAAVRFSLKRVFNKLGVSRQSELAVFVTRLGSLGI